MCFSYCKKNFWNEEGNEIKQIRQEYRQFNFVLSDHFAMFVTFAQPTTLKGNEMISINISRGLIIEEREIY